MAARAVSGFRSGSLDVFGASFDLGQLLGDASVGGGLSAEWAALGGVSHGPSASPPGDAPTPEPSAHQPSFGGGAGPAPDQGFLRCVDTSHDKTPCPWCTPPPTPDTELEYELVGDPGKKARSENGEKRLRSLITHTPEWNDSSERARVALEADRLGNDSLAAVLRTKGCSSLRKTHLLYLAREWGYQSDLWCKREARRAHNLKMDRQRAQKAAAEAAAAAAAAAAGLLGAGGGGDEPGAAAYIPVPSLAPPLVQPPPAPPRSGTPTPGGGTKRTAAAAGLYPSGAAWADGGVPPPSSLPSLMWPRKGAERSTAGGIAAWAADVCRGPLASGAAALGAAASGSSADDDSSQPLAAIAAHATLALRPLAEESVRLFGGEAPPDVAGAHHHGAVAAAAVWLADIAADTFSALASLRARAATLPASTASSVAWLQLLGRACPLEDCMLRLQHGLHCATLDVTRPGPGPALQRWPGDMVRGALTALELVARCQSLTTQSKFVSYGAYVKITLALKELMANYTHAAATALQARADAMAALLEEHGQHGGEGETAQGGGGGGGGGDHGGGPGGGNGGAEPAGNGHGGGGGGGGAEEGGDAHGGASLSPGGLGLTLNLGGLPGFGGVPPLPTGGAPPPPLAPLRGVPPIWSGPILVMAGNGAGGGLRLPPIVSRALDEDEVQGARAAAAAAEALPAQSDASGMGPQQRR